MKKKQKRSEPDPARTLVLKSHAVPEEQGGGFVVVCPALAGLGRVTILATGRTETEALQAFGDSVRQQMGWGQITASDIDDALAAQASASA